MAKRPGVTSDMFQAFGPKNVDFHAWVKKCHFGNLSEWAGMAVPCDFGPQEFLTGTQKLF